MTVVLKPGLGPLDLAYSKWVLKTLPIWHTIGFTPNVLTTLGLVTSIACVYYVWKRNVGLALAFLMLRMYFDYADGLMARKYEQLSELGDWYDHIVDTFAFGIPLIIVLLASSKPVGYTVPVVLAIIASMINNGCSENEYRDATGERSASLSLISKMCVSGSIFKWTDGVVQYLIISIVIYIMCVNDPRNV